MELRVLSALLALTVSISPGPSALGNPSPVGGSLTGIFTADDYPPDALDLNQEGSVGVLVRVDPKGAVSDCMVTSSSGFPALDAQTCRVVWLRAIFTPARDASGVPVTSTYQQSIHWAIGDDDEGETSDPYMVRWIVSGWQNDYPSCRTELGGAAESDRAGATRCPPYVAGIPASLPGRAKTASDIVIEQRFSVGASPTVTLAPADTFIGRELARLDIDVAGKVSSCKVVETTGTIPPQLSRACLITAKQYARKKDAKGTPAPFTAYFMINLFGR
jgi:TonB family protein